jgi:hypothetical protein
VPPPADSRAGAGAETVAVASLVDLVLEGLAAASNATTAFRSGVLAAVRGCSRFISTTAMSMVSNPKEMSVTILRGCPWNRVLLVVLKRVSSDKGSPQLRPIVIRHIEAELGGPQLINSFTKYRTKKRFQSLSC